MNRVVDPDVGRHEDHVLTEALDSQWRRFHSVSSLRDHHYMVRPIRCTDSNRSWCFSDRRVADVFLLLATAGKREREYGLLGMDRSLWSRLDIYRFVDRIPDLPGVISRPLDTSVSRLGSSGLDGTASDRAVRSRTWFGEHHKKRDTQFAY